MGVKSGFEPELSIGPRFRFAYIFKMVKMTPRYIDVDGYKYCEYFIPDLIRAAINYKPTDKDVFVATYPKCGTTWMIQKVMLILNKGKVPDTIEEYFSSCPFLEMLGPDEISRMPGPGCIKIHFPFNLTPYSPDAKYVYVARNPKDCCISFYHHTKAISCLLFPKMAHLMISSISSSRVKQILMITSTTYCHGTSTEMIPMSFFVTYEEMKKESKDTIKKLAGFLGEEYSSALADNEELLDEIALKSSFEYMQKTTNNLFIEMLDRCEEYAENPNVPKGFKAWSKFNAIAIKDGQGSNETLLETVL
ncbi:sulfotransferase 1C4 [Caerostris extrusa]|uniref:Sulfotransferase 1C4 n=1 Tax=Caerostris extrusa TaxID=172846 RepID=A0AAV4MXU2_CAEEX|nr:sulfotransferase 1C4 [Caerostris extrusa]